MSNYVRLCPKNSAEFLTFRREDFFAAYIACFLIIGIFISSLANQGFVSYLYISISVIFFLRAMKSGFSHCHHNDTGHH